MQVSDRFPHYTRFNPKVPVRCITPDLDGCIHRFFDVSSISPSGRYVGLTRLHAEDRLPSPGDRADIVVVDLLKGDQRVVAETRGGDTQMGAHVQWGADDTQLFFNDVDIESWRPFGVMMDPASGESENLSGTVYAASRDGNHVASTCLRRTGLTQKGYGVHVPTDRVHLNEGPVEDDGLSVTDLLTGETRLLVSFKDIFERAIPAYDPSLYEGRGWYGFHVKWNRGGDRLMLVCRCLVPDGCAPERRSVVTMRADGSDLRVAVGEEMWALGGHHPDWGPDGTSVTMNLRMSADGPLSLIQVNHDGSDLHVLTTVAGSGHPTLHPNGRHILTDVYLNESLAYGDGTTPIRWIDTATHTEEAIVRINNDPPYPGPKRELRIDPHPAWDRSYRHVVFNGCDNGVRRVYLADLSDLVD